MTFLHHEAIKNYCRLVMVIFLISFCLKIWETIFLYTNHFFSAEYFLWQLHGLCNDIGFISTYCLILLPFYGLIFWWKKSVANGLLIFFAGTYFILESLLIYYFNESLTPLTVYNLTGMTGEQVAVILEIYGFTKIQLLFLLPAYLMVYFIFWSLRKKFLKPSYTLSMVAIVIVSFFIELFFPSEIKNFDSELNYHVVVNKVKYLKQSYDTYTSQKNEYTDSEIDTALKAYYQMNNISDQAHYNYPFFSEKEIRNPLGNFFPKKDTTPNVVFIICESLGKQFSGPEARLGSFTPFIDSLAKASLYWTNFMANAERTFGALPNILAGVPEGDRGFMNLKSKMPDHLSIPLLLKDNNSYQTGFFCGANQAYDHMESYLLFQKIDYIFGKESFSQNINKREITDKNGTPKLFNWGAEDAVVFNESLKLMDSIYSNKKPYCNVYLTTSFHEPYAYENEQQFIQKAKDWINDPKTNHDKLEKKESYLAELHHLATIMYMDNSLRNFFSAYQKRTDFENTIFIICGDHSIKFMSDDSRMEKYHVPLLIYSPLLTRTKKIKSMACHKDIPSALQGLLKNNFGLKMPEFSISQSDNLDTLSTFSAGNANHVLMYADKRMENYIWKDYFFADGALFQLKDKLKPERIDNDEVLKQMERRITNYKILSQYVANANAYIPDTIFTRFTKLNYLYQLKNESGNRTKKLGQNELTEAEQYSGIAPITNNNKAYLDFIKNLAFQFTKTLRVKVKFKIKSPSSKFPILFLDRKEFSADKKTKNQLRLDEILLDNSDGYFEQTKEEGWYNFEGVFWIKEIVGASPHQCLGLYLGTHDKIIYFIDDLEIEVREF